LWTPICAGEKDVITAVRLGFVATTNPGGEGKGQWTPELNKWFAGKLHVAIMEDRDKTGEAHVIEVAKALLGIVPDIRIVRFLELPEDCHGDLTDWVEADPARRGYAELLARIEAAKPITAEDFPPAGNTDEPSHGNGADAGQGDYPGEDTPAEKIKIALAVIPPTSREDRINYGRVLYRWSGGSEAGFTLFTGWLAARPSFVEAKARRVWIGFKKDRLPAKVVTLASIFGRANEMDPTWRDRWGEVNTERWRRSARRPVLARQVRRMTGSAAKALTIPQATAKGVTAKGVTAKGVMPQAMTPAMAKAASGA
jgi:hypothetical protein